MDDGSQDNSLDIVRRNAEKDSRIRYFCREKEPKGGSTCRNIGIDNANGQIPNYKVLQSASALDWGRNVNTLNCISINYPLYFSVIRDPDAMSLYSAVGQAIGIYFVNTLNMQTGYVYKLNYPSSVDNCQIFSMGHRRGTYGYDGISLKQEEELPEV